MARPVTPAPAKVDVWSDENREQVLDGAKGTTESVIRIADRIRALSPKARTSIQQAAQVLQGNCPYNRAAFQIPIVLSAAADRIEADALTWGVREEWRRIQAGLRHHVGVVELVGGPDLTAPSFVDHLLGRPEIVSRAELMEGDSIAATRALLDHIPEAVASYSTPTLDRIRDAEGVLEAETSGLWPLKLELVGWRMAIERVRVHVHDPVAASQLDAMVDLLAVWLEQRC